MTPPPLIVLHGANGSATDMQPLLERLGPERPVIAFDMLGHGGRDIPETLSIPALAKDVLAQCDAAGIEQAHWFGYSVGGLIALRLAVDNPERMLSLATLTTKINYDAAGVAHAVHLTNPERILRSNPARAEALKQMHAPQDWLQLIAVVRHMFEGFADQAPITMAELRAIDVPVLALGALEDPLVPAAEVRRLASLLPRAVPALFAGTAHPLGMAPLDTIVRTMSAFTADPVRVIRSARVKLHEFRWDRAT